jgi:hypothetical protein
VLKGKGTAGFSVGTYDPSRLLVIDPVVTYATRLGGTHASGGAAAAAEAGAAVAVDPAGNAYVTGTTNSYDFPGVGSAIGDSVCFHPSEQFCEFGFVTKIDPTGSVILYSSIFGEGGQVAASGTGIAVDQQGNAYITGSTLGGMPTKNALQPLFAGGSDAFVFKLDSAGHLVFCTYLGGSGDESAGDIAADPFGNIVVTGYTSSPNFPVANAFQSTHFGSTRSDYDAFVTKLTGDGSAMVFSTYLGGSSLDFGGGVAADTAGNVYATGTTFSFGFPTTPGAFQSTSTGANAVAYVSKFDPVGNVVYSTLLGGTSSIAGQFSGAGAIAVDGAGSAYVTGRTSDPSFPTSPGAFQQTFGQTFVTKFNASGSGLVYSTFLGGSNGNDGGSGLAVNSAGEAYVGGLTSSSDFPTIDAFRQAPPCQLAACTDGFVAKLNAAGSGLIYSSYVGGLVSGLFFDSSRSVYLTGSRGFATPNAAQTSYGNAFLAKITETGNQAPVARATAATQPTECSSSHGTTVRLDGSASSDPDNDQITFEWKDSSDHVVGTSAVVQVTVPLGTSNFTLTVNDGNGGTASANVAVRVVDTAAPSLILSTDTMTLVLPTASASGMAASVNGIATASDTCDAAPVVSSLAPVQFAVGITHVPLTATDASGNSTTRDLIVHVAYNFNGSTIPQNIGGSAPIRFALTAADGSRIDNATANIEVFVLHSGGVLQPVSVLSSGGANSGTLFRFDPVNQQYIYNLSTKNYPPGAYVLRVRINDQTSYDTPISIR